MNNENTATVENSTQVATVQEDPKVSMLARIVEIERVLASIKPLYDEKEKLTLALKSLAPVGAEYFFNGMYVKLVDNFESRNTVFRPAAVKRFDLDIESLESRQLKVAKEEAKLAKKAK